MQFFVTLPTRFIFSPMVNLMMTCSRAYLPTLVPVEVEESKARDWFHFLLSGVEFLHARGVVHNDIKFVHPCHFL